MGIKNDILLIAMVLPLCVACSKAKDEPSTESEHQSYAGACDSIVTYMHTMGTEKRSHKVEYAYDSRGNTTLRADYEWNNNTWVGQQKYIYTYDNNNTIVTQTLYRWTDGTWAINNVCNYNRTYDNQGRILLLAYTVEDFNAGTTSSTKITSTYDAQGRIVADSTYNLGKENWTLHYTNEYAYDFNNYCSCKIQKYYNGENKTKNEYTHDAQGNELKNIEYQWRDSIWKELWMEEQTYDGQGNVMTWSIHYSNYGGDLSYKMIYSYNEKGKIARNDYYDYVNNEGQCTETSYYYYAE